jgi:UDP-2,3-diacylglucosamine hydrolase
MSRNGEQTHRRGIVISDLHLFARRSRGAARFDAVREKLNHAEVLVLNGDIFDFRWSTLGDQQKTLPAAMDWLSGLANDFPDCQIHFIIGNHDCTVAFQRELSRFAAGQTRFQWHEYLLRLGPALFFHGDCAHRRMDRHGLNRFRGNWQRDWCWSPALATAYECVDRLGITRRVHEWHFPKQKTVERIAYYLDNTCPGWRDQTRDCFFGHTHLPFSNYKYEGVSFHNTGSAIHNLEFNPIHFEAPLEGGKVAIQSRSRVTRHALGF